MHFRRVRQGTESEEVKPASLLQELENSIIFGVYAPGSRITEDAVMEKYDAKRHAVRHAFAELESYGLLIHRPRRGMEVVSYTPDEVEGLCDLRIVLETAAARYTSLPVDPRLIEKLREIAARHEEALRQEDFRQAYVLNQRFHEMQYRCCNNPRLMDLIARHARMSQLIRLEKKYDADQIGTIVDQHLAIIDAMSQASVDGYEASVSNHLLAAGSENRRPYEGWSRQGPVVHR